MSLFADTFCEIVLDYLANEGNSDIRLLVPAPTHKIGYRLQEKLVKSLQSEIPAYLIVDSLQEKPCKEKNWITPEGITSLRLGSFVLIVQPGNVSRIPESVMRAANISFNDEWPWSVAGESESFSFKSAVLPSLVEKSGWGISNIEANTIISLLGTYALNGLAGSADRNTLLFDEFIDGFELNSISVLENIFQKILFHIGIPNVDMQLVDSEEYLKVIQEDCKKLNQKITSVTRSSIVESLEDDEDIILVNGIYDGLGSSISEGSGILSMRKSSKFLKDTDWESATLEKLFDIFNVKKDRKISLKAEFYNSEDEDFNELYVSPQKDYLIIKEGSYFKIRCTWDLDGSIDENKNPEDSDFKLELRQGKKILESYPSTNSSFLPNSGSHEFGEFNISDSNFFGEKNSGKAKPISVCITSANEVTKKKNMRLKMLCPNFSEALVLEEPFNVFDHEIQDDLREPDAEQLDLPSNIIVLSIFDVKGAKLFQDDERSISLKPLKDCAIGQITVDAIDPSKDPAGEVKLKVIFSNKREIYIDLKSMGIPKGLFSLEEALISELIKDRSDKELLHKIFSGENTAPYPKLGGLSDENSYRVNISKRMEAFRGALPIILPLGGEIRPELAPVEHVLMGGSFDFNEGQFVVGNDSLAHRKLESYQQSRKKLIDFYIKYSGDENLSSKHPLYARVPTYIHEKKIQIESLIVEYLNHYQEIIKLISQDSFTRAEEFVLSSLDCVILSENTESIGDYRVFLIGPWHPLQVADRFQRQQTKFHASQWCLENPKSSVNKLAGILDDLTGIRSIHAFKSHHNFLHAYVSDSSDLSWSIALKISGDRHDFAPYSKDILRIFDLQISAIPDTSSSQTKSYIRDFMAANPSERRLEIYVREGLNINEIHSSVADLLYSEDNDLHKQLVGGVHLYFQNLETSLLSSVEWKEPPICIYDVKNEEECLKENHIDILIVAPDKGFSGRLIEPNEFTHIPRGVEGNASMSLVLSKLVDGAQDMSDSTYQETPYLESKTQNIVTDAYLETIRLIPSLVNNTGFISERAVRLPKNLAASWVILPGNSTDPAMLSRYVNSSVGSENQRVLWEYNVDLTASRSDYFILSEIALGFKQALSTSNFRNFNENQIIADLSKVGIAVGGEALRTGMKALGVVGQVGAVRLFISNDDNAPLRDSIHQVGLLIPVDSFDSVLGSQSQIKNGSNKKSDLFAIQLTLNEEYEPKVMISAASIEAKFSSSIYPDDTSAFEQARQTFDRFKELVDGTIKSNGVIQRFVLAKLIRYGLQLKYQTNLSDNLNRNYKIIDNILKGQVSWISPKYETIVCSTEGELKETSFDVRRPKELRVRLSPNDWPNERHSGHDGNLNKLKKKLETIFVSTAFDYPSEFEKRSTHKPDGEPIEEPNLESGIGSDLERDVDTNLESGVAIDEETGLGTNAETDEEADEDAGSEPEEGTQIGKISNARLEETYEKLLTLLNDKKNAVFRPDDGYPFIIEGPASVLYRFEPDYNVDPKKIEAQSNSMHLVLRLEEQQKVRIFIHLGYVNIDVPKLPEERYFVKANWLWKRWKRPDSGLAVPLGINQRKKIIDINFSDADSPHLLIGGTTGGGKSEALNTILRGLLEYYSNTELGLILVDPKGTELIEFEQSPYLIKSVGTDASDAIDALNRCVDEMEYRNKDLFANASRASGKRINSLTAYNKAVNCSEKLPWWLIVLDEYHDLTSDPEDKKEVERLLGRLAAKARSAGIHIIIATQKPSVEVINSTLRSNLPAQLALSVKSRHESTVIMDEIGAEVLNGKGDGFLKIGGKLNRIQCAWIPEDD